MESVIQKLCSELKAKVAKHVYGHDAATELLFGAFLIGGHTLLEGPPGIAKTRLGKAFASALGLRFNRIQFTPDLMPSDITGVNIFDPKVTNFRFSPGPLFADVILADEINRTPPKTQAALLESMEERQITVDGDLHKLSRLFFVVATQNPIEHEGTFPLPEAQLDRFLYKIILSYPGRKSEQEIIERLSGKEGEIEIHFSRESPLCSERDLLEARSLLRGITLSPSISTYILEILYATRNHPSLLLGGSSRAGLYLALAAKFCAALEARNFVIPDDVHKILVPVLAHRLVPKPEAWELTTQMSELIEDILKKIPIPSS